MEACLSPRTLLYADDAVIFAKDEKSIRYRYLLEAKETAQFRRKATWEIGPSNKP